MKKILLIIRREYITRVRKKIFIVATLLTPIGFAMTIIIPMLLNKASSETKTVVVMDESGVFDKKFENNENVTFTYTSTPYETLKKTYKSYHFSGILHVPADYNVYNNSVLPEYYSHEQIGFETQEALQKQLTDIATNKRLNETSENITPTLLKAMTAEVPIKTTVASAEGEKRGNAAIATAIGAVMAFFLYFVILLYGVMVMRGVMEEKMNRIAEIMISSVKPFQLMMGKIVGIALVGLTQVTIWIMLLIVIWSGMKVAYSTELAHVQKAMQSQSMQQNSAMGQQQLQQQMGGWQAFETAKNGVDTLPVAFLIFGFVFYFFGGYMVYASLFAAVGSATGDEPDQAQSLSLIATLPIILSSFIMVSTLKNPNSTLAVVASIFPLTSPIVMCGRLAFEPPLWQVIASMVCLVGGFIFTVWLAGKIYRTGILMYGKKVTLRELGKWIMYKN